MWRLILSVLCVVWPQRQAVTCCRHFDSSSQLKAIWLTTPRLRPASLSSATQGPMSSLTPALVLLWNARRRRRRRCFILHPVSTRLPTQDVENFQLIVNHKKKKKNTFAFCCFTLLYVDLYIQLFTNAPRSSLSAGARPRLLILCTVICLHSSRRHSSRQNVH